MKRFGRYIFTSILLMLIYIALLFFCCLYDFLDTDIKIPSYILGIRSDKWIHFAMFFPFPFICRLLLSLFTPFRSKRYITSMTILLLGVVLAIITELFQHILTDYRSMDYTDSIADCTGLIAGVVVAHYLFLHIKEKALPSNGRL